MVVLSPALPLEVYSVCAVDWAVDQPTGSWLAPARALASAEDCTCRFCRYQPPTSTTNPATPSSETMKNIIIGSVWPAWPRRLCARFGTAVSAALWEIAIGGHGLATLHLETGS